MPYTRTHKVALAVAATVLLGGVAATANAATSRVSAPEGQVIACMNTKTGAIRIIDADQACATKGTKKNPGLREQRIVLSQTGAVGATGLTGPTGAPGVTGDKGDRGDKGEPGIQGVKGDDGIQGPNGEQGIQGEKGEKGEQGIQGFAGEKGEKGEQGDQGIQGIQGLVGQAGTSGAKGDKGDAGSAGTKGDQGIQGIQGAKGDQGIQGIQGPKGDQGADGTDGAGGTMLVDGNGVVLGKLIAATGQQVTFQTKTDYLMIARWDGTFFGTQIYYTGACGEGTPYFNGGTNGPLYGKTVYYALSLKGFVAAVPDDSGTAPSEAFTSGSLDSGTTCATSVGSRTGMKMAPISAKTLGIPDGTKLATPLTLG